MAKTKLKFLEKAEESEVQSVNARVPAKLYEDFQEMKELAKKKGFRLNLSAIVTAAMEEAVKEAEKELGVTAGAPELPMGRDASPKAPK